MSRYALLFYIQKLCEIINEYRVDESPVKSQCAHPEGPSSGPSVLPKDLPEDWLVQSPCKWSNAVMSSLSPFPPGSRFITCVPGVGKSPMLIYSRPLLPLTVVL